MQKADTKTRRLFLKSIPAAIISISAFSFFKSNRKSVNYSEKKFKTLSKEEADKIIKNEKFPIPVQIKPATAPVTKEI